METHPNGSPPNRTVELRGGSAKVVVAIEGGRLVERYGALGAGGWVEVATGGGETPAGEPRLEGCRLVIPFNRDGRDAVRTIEILDGGPWIRVASRVGPGPSRPGHDWCDRFRFPRPPDWTFAPSVGGFCPDAQYKAPLILVQAGPLAFGIVPDLSGLGERELRRCNHAMDLDVPAGPVLTVGFIPARLAYHSVYSADPERTWEIGEGVENAYFVLLAAAAEPAAAYREAVRFHWERFGRAAQSSAAGQQRGTGEAHGSLGLWDDWREAVWRKESPLQWLEVPLPDGTTGGGVATRRWGPGPSVYLSSWFNTMRTSFGLALFARRAGDTRLLGLAGQTLALALGAPGRDGAFKCIAVPREDGSVLWAAGDGCGASTPDGYLGYDMAWTGYWLLRWRAAGLPGAGRILGRCRELARFLMRWQADDGMLPTRFGDDGRPLDGPSRAVKAETGPVAHFLLELHGQDADPAVLRSALGGLEFIRREVAPTRQWYDYETFWSCSPREARLDARTGQWPANNLALIQTVAAFLLAHRAAGEAGFLRTGERLLDYLLLTQQCWTNPLIDDLSGPSMLLGGFTTQNSDAEWSDARQSQCGAVLLDYHRETGRVEYLERGIAALRAQFPVSPAENWAHTGYGRKEGVSSFHWGTGSGMAGIEIEQEALRDAVVDLRAARGVGVNGLDLADCRVADGAVSFRLSSPFQWRRPPQVIFIGADLSASYRVVVNGLDAGTWTGEALGRGVPVAPARAAGKLPA